MQDFIICSFPINVIDFILFLFDARGLPGVYFIYIPTDRSDGK